MKEHIPQIRPPPQNQMSTLAAHSSKYGNPNGIKLLTSFQVGLSHLSKHKFRHNFQGSLNPFCNISVIDILKQILTSFCIVKTTQIKEKSFSLKISNIKHSLLNQNDAAIVKTFIFRLKDLSGKKIALII